jgi:hypothetical protein
LVVSRWSPAICKSSPSPKNSCHSIGEVIYQTIENLHDACPGNTGDWYFTGNYPTPGGNRVCNRALLNFLEGKNQRGY